MDMFVPLALCNHPKANFYATANTEACTRAAIHVKPVANDWLVQMSCENDSQVVGFSKSLVIF